MLRLIRTIRSQQRLTYLERIHYSIPTEECCGVEQANVWIVRKPAPKPEPLVGMYL